MILLLFAQLPLADVPDWKPFAKQVEGLLAHPGLDAKAVRAALAKKDADEVQKLLDAHCLVGVSINPESRVKAARGPSSAALTLKKPTLFLVKIRNDGGVTHPLGIAHESNWLDASFVDKPGVRGDVSSPDDKGLSGRSVEYRVLRLVPREAGKREAVLSFDVGQGTQDLGFRAEVPILFAVARK